MKEIIKKTDKEIEGEEILTKIKVSEVGSGYFYFACESCNVAFFGEDIILKSSKDGYKCPLKIKQGSIDKFLHKNKHFCGRRIYGGNEECFNKFYKLK